MNANAKAIRPAGPVARLPLAPVYVAGEVRRWHANPAMARHVQTNADHQGRCVQLLLLLHPSPSLELLRAVALHDVGEVMGDLPRPVKVANPAVAAGHAMIEKAARERMCGDDPFLTEEEFCWFLLVDQLEAAAFVIFHNPAEAMRKASGWEHDRSAILRLAGELGVEPQVSALIDDLLGGNW